jgi:D-citramalate synthase
VKNRKKKDKNKKVQILDTTLRDGEQTTGVAFTAEEKLTIAKGLLLDVRVDAIEAGSARVSKGEFEAVRDICKWAKERRILYKVETLGFVDDDRSVDWIYKAGGKVLNLLCKGSLKHLSLQLRKSKEEHVKDINKTIEYAKSRGIKTNIYLEDASNGLKDSKEYVFYLLDNIKAANRIMIPDTLGIWNYEECYSFCKELTDRYDYEFDFHGHNDYGLAVANSLAALNAGVTRVHTTVNGLGERAGNCPLSQAAVAINDHIGYKLGVVEKNLKNMSMLIESLSGVRIAQNSPIIGENVFTQCCGVHADGDKKGNLYCNTLIPERFGGERIYALGKSSGKASIQKNLELLGIELDDVKLQKVLARVVELGDKKEKITLSDLPYIVADVLGEAMLERVKLLDFSLAIRSYKKPVARVKLSIDGDIYENKASGDGLYDSFMLAVQKIYLGIGKKLPRLVDYSVRIPPGGKTDALVETLITWENGGTFKTKGVDPDQTTAAIKATLNMLNREISTGNKGGL